MTDIKITVRDKAPLYTDTEIYCNNSDYTVTWDLDEEWAAYDTKTMRTTFPDCTYEDTVFTVTADDNGKVMKVVDGAWAAGEAWIVPSSTPNSTKRFKITVDDSGTISATEVVE